MTPLRVLFAASGEFAVPTLRALVAAGHAVVQVVTQPDRPAGRGRMMTPTPTAQVAESLGLPVVRTDDVNALADSLPACDVMVVIAFGQKIADSIIHKPRLGAINLHASRLPRYRGAAPINWAILGGDAITGNSVIRLAQKMDAGDILAQSEVVIGEVETAGELHDRLAEDGGPLVLGVLESLASGTATPVVQDHAKATLARKLSRESARIDWQAQAEPIARQIRGMYPWPGCRVEVVEGQKLTDTLTLVRAKAISCVAGSAPQKPGTLLDPAGIIHITAGNGSAIQILDVQPAGKRPMPIADYCRGHRWHAGMILRSI
jgi:methionyl-tRNA formyltransferase